MYKYIVDVYSRDVNDAELLMPIRYANQTSPNRDSGQMIPT